MTCNVPSNKSASELRFSLASRRRWLGELTSEYDMVIKLREGQQRASTSVLRSPYCLEN